MYSGYAEQLKTIKNTHLSSTIYIADMTGQCRISRGNGRAVGRGIKAPIFWFFGPPLCSKCSFAFGGGPGGGSRSVQVRSGHVGEIHTRRHMFGFICKNFGNLISWTKNHDTPQKIKSSYSEASFCHVFCLVFFLCTKILVYCLFLSLNCFSSRVLREF